MPEEGYYSMNFEVSKSEALSIRKYEMNMKFVFTNYEEIMKLIINFLLLPAVSCDLVPLFRFYN